MATHCLPSGGLGTAEVGVPRIDEPDQLVKPAAGTRRGIAVMLHGIQNPEPPNAYNATVPAWETFANSLAADNRRVFAPLEPGDGYPSNQLVAVTFDFAADPSGNCSRLFNNVLRWWDHYRIWLTRNYPGDPVLLCGLSWGGWHALQIARHRPADIAGVAVMVPVTVLSDVTTFGWNAFNTTGADTNDNQLDAITCPAWIGWGTTDTTVGNTHTQAIANNAIAAGRTITTRAAAHGHTIDAADAAAMAAWAATV